MATTTMTPQAVRAVLAASILFAFAGAGFAVYGVIARGSAAGRTATPAPIATADALQAAFVSVADRVRPAVVHIGTLQVARGRRPPMIPGPKGDDPFFKDFFDQFFGRSGPGRREEFQTPGLGSGVIVDKRGYVLTNFHVIRGADAVTVRLADKQEFRGRIVGSDSKTDIAIIKFEAPVDVRVATLGNSDALRVGEWAIAIGNPFGLDQTVTVGVVSATGRADVGIATYENFIQADAKGAIVARVYPGSPAATAGLAQNDVIVSFDGTPVEDYHQLQRMSSEAEVGRTVKVDVMRRHEKKSLALKVAEAPDSGPSAESRAK